MKQKTGKNELLQTSKIWDLEYKQRVSVTSNDSLVIEINRIKKMQQVKLVTNFVSFNR